MFRHPRPLPPGWSQHYDWRKGKLVYTNHNVKPPFVTEVRPATPDNLRVTGRTLGGPIFCSRPSQDHSGNGHGRVLGPRFFSSPSSAQNSHPPRARAACQQHSRVPATNPSQFDGQVPDTPFPPSRPSAHHTESNFCSTHLPPVPVPPTRTCTAPARAGVHRGPNRQPRKFFPPTACSGHVPAFPAGHTALPALPTVSTFRQTSQASTQWRSSPLPDPSPHTGPSSNAMLGVASSAAGMTGQPISNETFSLVLDPRYTSHQEGHTSDHVEPLVIQQQTDGWYSRDIRPGQHSGCVSNHANYRGHNDSRGRAGRSYHRGRGGPRGVNRFGQSGVSSRAAYGGSK